MWDVFISHASEDKETIAKPLAEELRKRGLNVWYDEFSLELGDSLRRSIDAGLAHSRFGVVILSPRFFAKQWPQRELDGLTSREVSGEKVVLPVWHDITFVQIAAASPTLADRLAISTDQGLSAVADAVERVITRSRPTEVSRNLGSADRTSLPNAEGPHPGLVPQDRRNTGASTKTRVLISIGSLGLIGTLTLAALTLRPDRSSPRSASVQAMDMAHAALEDEDTTGAIVWWTRAAQLDTTNVNAVYFIGHWALLQGDTVRAIPAFRRLLAMPAPTTHDTFALEEHNEAVIAVLGYGGQLFNQGENSQAAEVLNAVRTADPQNSDAHYWTALALYKLQRWSDLAEVAARVVQLTPLNFNAFLLLRDANDTLAERARADGNAAEVARLRHQAMRALFASEGLPVQVEQVSLSTAGDTTTVRGVVIGAAIAAGSPIRLEFTLSTPSGNVGKGTVELVAPVKDQRVNFEFPIQVNAWPTGFRYRLAQ